MDMLHNYRRIEGNSGGSVGQRVRVVHLQPHDVIERRRSRMVRFLSLGAKAVSSA